MGDPIMATVAEIQEALAMAQMRLSSLQRMLLAGASDEGEECTHPAEFRSDVSGMGRSAFHCRKCDALVEVESGEADPS